MRGASQEAFAGDAAPPRLDVPGVGARSWIQAVGDLLERNVFLVMVLTAAGVFRLVLLGLGIGSDSWYTLVGGRFVSRSWLPHDNTLTILGHGREWVDQQWLAHLLVYGLWGAGRWAPIVLATLVSFLGAYVITAATAERLGASPRSTAVAALFAVVVGLGQSGFRAETLAYPLFAALLFLLLDDERRPSRRVYLALPLLVLWANVHGSVLLAAALVSIYGLRVAVAEFRAPRSVPARAWALTLLPWFCTLASPYGAALPGYYVRLLHNPALTRFVSEWQPATIKSEPLFFALLAGAAALLVRSRSRTPVFAQLALLLTAIGGLLAVRHIPWFALTAAAVLPLLLDDVWPAHPAPRHPQLNIALAVASLAVLVAAAAAYAGHGRSWFEREYPARAGNAVASAAAAAPDADVFADERYADWLLFEHPALSGRIAYDVRFELLSQRELTQIARFRLEQGADWQRVAAPYRILVLDPASDARAIDLLARGAHTLYRDRNVVVIERPSSR